MVFNKPTRGRPTTRAATIPVRRLGSKPSVRRLSSALRRTSVPPESQPNQEGREHAPRDVRLTITRLADSVIKRHASVSRGGTGLQRIKVDLNARSVEEALKSVPTLEESPPPSAVTPPILREYQIPNSDTAGSYASILTGPVPPEGRERSAVETVLSDPMPPQELPAKRQSVVSRLLQRTQVSTRSKSTKNKRGGDVESPKHVMECTKAAAARSRPTSVVMLNELEVEYNTSLPSVASGHDADKSDVVTSSAKESSDVAELETKDENGSSIGCVKSGTESCGHNAVSDFLSRFTASFCGAAEVPTVKTTSVEHEPLDDDHLGAPPVLPETNSTFESPLQHNMNESVVPSASQGSPVFQEETLKTVTEQQERGTSEVESEGGGQAVPGVATLLADPLPTNSTLQGELLSPATSPLLDDAHGREAREPEGQEESRDEATELTGRVNHVVASTPTEALPGASKGLRIVPLFGFMSGVIGQCYFVSLSPENEFHAGTDALAPEERLLRFLEAVATRTPDQLAQQDQMAARELVDALSPDEAVADSNSLTEFNAGSIGVLRREGDEYFVDPLPGFNQIGSESKPATSHAEESAPAVAGSNGLLFSDVSKTWDAHASALAAEARSAVDKILLTFTKRPRGGEELEGEHGLHVEGNKHVSNEPSLETVDTDKFLHGTYSWFSI